MKPTADRLADVEYEPNTGCWLWSGPLTRGGYGVMPVRRPGSSTGWGATRAHRTSYEHHVGPIPDGLHVLHKCDTRACINPDHLFLGTHGENMRDMVAKGRHVRASNSRSITDEQVFSIRLNPDGQTGAAMARMYGVSEACISRIRNGIRR